jgi:hypothetical protein
LEIRAKNNPHLGHFGNGDWLRGQTEHCVLATRGTPIVTLTNQSTVVFAPARGHSVKPIEFYALIESLCPAPRYADLFSRYRHNDNWDCHGAEAPPLEKPYDATDDFARSLEEGYRVIRERVVAGGPVDSTRDVAELPNRHRSPRPP